MFLNRLHSAFTRPLVRRRYCSVDTDKQCNVAKPLPPAIDPYNDWIGPPDAGSKIRFVELRRCAEESIEERSFRHQYEETQQWNHEFWKNHNAAFYEQQRHFMSCRHNEVSPEELSQFYRNFLNEHWTVHVSYNWQWYKKNVKLLWPAIKAAYKRQQRLRLRTL